LKLKEKRIEVIDEKRKEYTYGKITKRKSVFVKQLSPLKGSPK